MNLFQVNLFVKSLPEMLRFYRDTLGFEVNDIEPPAGFEPAKVAEMSDGATSLSRWNTMHSRDSRSLSSPVLLLRLARRRVFTSCVDTEC